MIITDAKLNKSDAEVQFSAWLTTQRSANGKCFKSFVANGYARNLRTEPPKLDIELTLPERDVFRCRTTAVFDALNQTFQAAPNFREVNRGANHGAFSAGLAAYRRYLEFMEFNEKNGETGIPQAQPIARENVEVKSQPTSSTDPLFVDFSDLSTYAGTRPVSCMIEGTAILATTWASMYAQVCEHLLAVRNRAISTMKMRTRGGDTALLLMDPPLRGLTCAKLSNGKYINTNYSAPSIINLIGKICESCGINKESIELTYRSNTAAVDSVPPKVPQRNCAVTAPAKVSVDTETLVAISLLLSEHFPYGYRLDSTIELMRFRQLFANEFSDTELPDDDGLKQLISESGMLFDEKLYVVGKTTVEKIKSEVDAALQNGKELIFYAVFYDYHREWLFAESVVSEEMLRSILEQLYPRFSFRANYFSPTYDSGNEVIKIGQGILGAWGDSVLMSYDQLAARLKYIPYDKIKTALAANDIFARNSTGVYTHTGKFEIYDEEKTAIADFVRNGCLADGYVSLNELPLNEIIERNYELSLMAIHTLVYKVCLADDYQRNGKIVSCFGYKLDIVNLLKKYCHTLDRCTVQELIDYETELTGEAYKPYVLQAGYESMVRIDEDTFLTERLLHFDRNAIDNAIDLFVGGYYTPLRNVTTFAAFPHCGQAWNSYLLESYCLRFSNRYRLAAASVNSANIGIIVRKTCELSLDEIMADAVANSGIPLETAEVLEYLCANGYIGKRKYSKVNEIIERARAVRGGGD